MGKIKIVGAERLQRKLKSNINLDNVKRVVMQNGAELQGKAQDYAPVDTGFLKSSIGISITEHGFTAESGPTANYGEYVEYGTRRMNAQPYMKPAFEIQKEQFKRDMDKLVR